MLRRLCTLIGCIAATAANIQTLTAADLDRPAPDPSASWRDGACVLPKWNELPIAGAAAYRQAGELHLHVTARPADNRLQLPRLFNVVQAAWSWPINAIPITTPTPTLPDSEYLPPPVPPVDRERRLTQTATEWTVHFTPADIFPCIVILQMHGLPHWSSQPPVITADPQGNVRLPAHAAVTSGEKLQFEPLTHKNTVGYWVDVNASATWQFETSAPAKYRVRILQGCGTDQGGSLVRISVADQQIDFRVVETGHFQNFRWRTLGTIDLPQATDHKLQVRCLHLANKAVMDVRQIRLELVDREPNRPLDLNNVGPDCFLPPLTRGPIAPGRRLLATAKSHRHTDVYHTVYLPTDWAKNGSYPVIVEWTGNGPYRNPRGDVSTGRVEDARLGYGIAGNDGAIWLSLPYLNAAGTQNVTQWWGSPPEHRPDSTLAYAHAAIAEVCETYGGDPRRLILVGFSRGSLACNALGLHADAPKFQAFVCFSHYDGVRTWPYTDSDRASALQRLKRLGQRRQFICMESAKGLSEIRQYLETTGIEGRFTLAETGFRNHDDDWVLRPSPVRSQLREWTSNVLSAAER